MTIRRDDLRKIDFSDVSSGKRLAPVHPGSVLLEDFIEPMEISRLEATEIVGITHPVLSRAAQPLPTALGTLDAIHLATALLWKEHMGKDLSMATHDVALAVAAKASGLRVIGA